MHIEWQKLADSCSKELPKNLTSKNAEIGKLKYKYTIQNNLPHSQKRKFPQPKKDVASNSKMEHLTYSNLLFKQ